MGAAVIKELRERALKYLRSLFGSLDIRNEEEYDGGEEYRELEELIKELEESTCSFCGKPYHELP